MAFHDLQQPRQRQSLAHALRGSRAVREDTGWVMHLVTAVRVNKAQTTGVRLHLSSEVGHGGKIFSGCFHTDIVNQNHAKAIRVCPYRQACTVLPSE